MKIGQLNKAAVKSPAVVIVFAARAPMKRWPKPATKAANNGRNTMIWIDDTADLSLHPVGIINSNRAATTEIDDEDGKPDGRLACRNG